MWIDLESALFALIKRCSKLRGIREKFRFNSVLLTINPTCTTAETSPLYALKHHMPRATRPKWFYWSTNYHSYKSHSCTIEANWIARGMGKAVFYRSTRKSESRVILSAKWRHDANEWMRTLVSSLVSTLQLYPTYFGAFIRCSSRSTVSEKHLMGPSMFVCLVFRNNGTEDPIVVFFTTVGPEVELRPFQSCSNSLNINNIYYNGNHITENMTAQNRWVPFQITRIKSSLVR
jgi:hypothetical protein